MENIQFFKKIDFWPFLKLQKKDIDLFDFTSFFAWTF